MTTSPVRLHETRTAAHPVSVSIEGRVDSLLQLRLALDALAHRRGFPVTGWSAWTFADCSVAPEQSSWAAVARHADGELAGMVMFNQTLADGCRYLTLAGTDQDTRGVLVVDSPETAELIAAHLDERFRATSEAVDLLLGPLEAEDPSVHAFAAALPGATLVTDAPVPALRCEEGRLEGRLSHGMRRTIRKAQNRLERDGRRLSFGFTRSSHEILELTHDMEQCHRERDHIHGRSSDLDDALGRRTWQWRLRELANLGRLELSTLHIDDQFAAYALGVLDGEVYRVVEGRFVTNWARYAPGRLLEAAVLQRVMDSSELTRTDWLSSVAPETLIAADDQDDMVRIHCSWPS
jgi:hypothetical protein